MTKTEIVSWLRTQYATSVNFQVIADLLEQLESTEVLLWSKDPPKKPGWYWYQACFFPQTRQIVYVYEHNNGYLARRSYYTDEESVTSLHCFWAGPILEPAQTGE